MNRYKVGQVPRCGAMDSKYFSNPEQFERDMEIHKIETEQFKVNLRGLLLAEPAKIQDRYNQAISVMLVIKQEHGL